MEFVVLCLIWFRNYLRNRKRYVCMGNCRSVLQNVNCGVPQGSILGPLLFLIYINGIQNCIPKSTVKLFADDTNLFVHGKTLSEAFYKANESVALLNDWFTANKLSLNIEKSCYSVFGAVSSDYLEVRSNPTDASPSLVAVCKCSTDTFGGPRFQHTLNSGSTMCI